MIMSFPLYFLARGQQSSEKFSEIVQRESESTVQHLGIVRSYSVEEMIRISWQAQNLRLKLALFGAIFVAFIAYAGLYGVLVHAVSVRQKELALRLTFGASSWTLQRIAIEKALLCCFAAIFLDRAERCGVAGCIWRGPPHAGPRGEDERAKLCGDRCDATRLSVPLRPAVSDGMDADGAGPRRREACAQWGPTYATIARLAPGVSVKAATAEMQGIQSNVAKKYTDAKYREGVGSVQVER
jgi:hypothetical protein